MSCCIPGCINLLQEYTTEFPLDRELAARWKNAIEVGTGKSLPPEFGSSGAVVCNMHFGEDQLKEGSLDDRTDYREPTIFISNNILTQVATCRLCLQLCRMCNMIDHHTVMMRKFPVLSVAKRYFKLSRSPSEKALSYFCQRCFDRLQVVHSFGLELESNAKKHKRLRYKMGKEKVVFKNTGSVNILNMSRGEHDDGEDDDVIEIEDDIVKDEPLLVDDPEEVCDSPVPVDDSSEMEPASVPNLYIGTYKCFICSITMDSKEARDRHLYVDHAAQEEGYFCEDCSMSFDSIVIYNVHLAKHDPCRPLKCSRCTQRFWKNIALIKHEAQHSKTNELKRAKKKMSTNKGKANKQLLISKPVGPVSSNYPQQTVRAAVEKVLAGGTVVRVAKEYSVTPWVLARWVKIHKNNETQLEMTRLRNEAVTKVFPDDLELNLVSTIIEYVSTVHDLPDVEVRKLAYEMATMNNLNVPKDWKKERKASEEWMSDFLERHPHLLVWISDGSNTNPFSLEQAQKFFDLMDSIVQAHPQFADGMRIFNLEEIAKNVSHKLTERKKVTTFVIVNALGNTCPPVMIFQCAGLSEDMLKGAPVGTLALATSTGIKEELFTEVLLHFIRNSQSSKENPSLLLFKNFSNYYTADNRKLMHDNGVTTITAQEFNYMLQPLKNGIMRVFDDAYRKAVDTWQSDHPDQTFDLGNVAECVSVAYKESFTPDNIVVCFRRSGIFPFDRQCFAEACSQSSSMSGIVGAADAGQEQGTDSNAVEPIAEVKLETDEDLCVSEDSNPLVFL
ncbi:uncharacterized protein LOC131691764 [Topomyia yanbarensis]|uniref:uncharacterized protein LOC131691764 n=1 Tax=Topomyia yanbarensis TaxID=2498891 RepID=UPI00273A83DC|nr:uncharacterized protein LOC131691764 [Topomyia yanbarensis]